MPEHTQPPSTHREATLPASATLRADALKQHFGVYGDFYEIMLGGRTYACRSVLELIAHTHTPADPHQIQLRHPDLLVIMMNPGSSKPLPPDFQPRIGLDSAPTRVKTRPDTTQYQIMRIMMAQGLKHARVLNLSDLREPKSVQLISTLQALKTLPDGDQHSLFCDARDEERHRLMGPHGAMPILAGWGRHKHLSPLATQCLRKVHGWRMMGVPAHENGLFYAHPSPMLQRKKEQWLATILQQFQNA